MVHSTLLLPTDPLDERVVDPEFARERDAGGRLDISRLLVNHDALVGDPPSVSLRGRAEADSPVIYRGWMMRADEYAALTAELAAQGLVPVTSAQHYATAHYLPGWVSTFASLTPTTAFLPVMATREEIMAAARNLGGAEFIVKDWVKSRKSDWAEACYSPSVERLPEVVAAFIRLQEDFLVGEVAIRKFVPLDPETAEVRVWWAHGKAALVGPHPDGPFVSTPQVPSSFIDEVRGRVEKLGCPFVTTDFARTQDGSWLVIEVGDGQVSGLHRDIDEESIDRLIASVLRP